jgi:predicted DNA-binding transcriptional regulator AlpA
LPKKNEATDLSMADEGFMSSEAVKAFVGIPVVTLDKMARREALPADHPDYVPPFPQAVKISGKRKGYPRAAVKVWCREILRRAARLPRPRA